MDAGSSAAWPPGIRNSRHRRGRDPCAAADDEVATITPIGSSFWTKLDGSFDMGFSYTKSSEISTLNVNSSTLYRRPRSKARLTASATLTTSTEDGHATITVRFRLRTCDIAARGCSSRRRRVRQQRKPRAAPALAGRGLPSAPASSTTTGLSCDRRRDRGQRRTQRRRQSHAKPGSAVHAASVVLPVRSSQNQRRYRLSVLPQPQQLGAPAHPARCQCQAGGPEGFLPCDQHVRYLRQPSPSADAAKNDVGVSFRSAGAIRTQNAECRMENDE